MAKKKNNKYSRFRRIAHPRHHLTYCEEYIEHLKSKRKKVPSVNHGTVCAELQNYFDPYDVGLDLGNKEIRHHLKREKANKIFFQWDKLPKDQKKKWYSHNKHQIAEVGQKKFNAKMVYEHITLKRKWYWTANPFSPIRPLGGDVDNHTDDPALVIPFLTLFESFYPGLFYDNGSSGKSLHPYPKIDMLPLYDYYCDNFSIKDEWDVYANRIIRYTGKIFKIYGHNILCPEHKLVLKQGKNSTPKLRPEYNVEFDAFKGTYPCYKYYLNKKGKVIITQMAKNGVLHKLPNIFTEDDLKNFRDAPVYSIIHHLTVTIYLINLLLLSGSYSDKDYKIIKLVQNEIEPMLEAHSVLSPCQGKNSVALPVTPITETTKRENNNILCIYNGTFENVDDISLEPYALTRSIRYLYYCYMDYTLKQGREPTKEEYREKYRQDVGTGEEDEEDIERLNYVYDTNISRMRKYAFDTLEQKIDKMQVKLGLTQEEVDNMSKYDKKLYLREVAITAVWIDLSLTNPEYIAKKEWWSMGKGEHFTRELTVPMNSLENFIECLKEKGLNKNGCKDNHRKAAALRKIVEKIEWMLCVDDSVVIAAHHGGQGGRAMRYILLPSHPNYQRFENIVGKDRVEYWMHYKENKAKSKRLKKKVC